MNQRGIVGVADRSGLKSLRWEEIWRSARHHLVFGRKIDLPAFKDKGPISGNRRLARRPARLAIGELRRIDQAVKIGEIFISRVGDHEPDGLAGPQASLAQRQFRRALLQVHLCLLHQKHRPQERRIDFGRRRLRCDDREIRLEKRRCRPHFVERLALDAADDNFSIGCAGNKTTGESGNGRGGHDMPRADVDHLSLFISSWGCASAHGGEARYRRMRSTAYSGLPQSRLRPR